MKKNPMRRINMKFYKTALAAILAAGMLLTGCGSGESGTGESATESTKSQIAVMQTSGGSSETAGSVGTVTILDVSDMFSNRDKEVGYEESDCIRITLNGTTAECGSSAVTVDGSVVTITEEGTYLISGTLQGQLIVDAGSSDKIQLVLDGADISCASSAALYVKQADKVFVTTAAGSENTLETTGEYVAIDDKNIDGAVFASDDITLNGEGTLTVTSAAGNGIVGKDDLVITSGSYVITAANHGVQGKDSIRIANGDLVITAGADGLHSGNDEDDTVGYTYLAGGNITITAGDDGMHSNTQLVIAGGVIDIAKSYEGLEGSSIEIVAGTVSVTASDDGLNAAGGNDNSGGAVGGNGFGGDPFAASGDYSIIISGGVLEVNAQGDGIDSNGNIYVNSGVIIVNGPTNGGNGALDCGANAYVYGGSVIALGASQMAVNFSSGSSQCAIMVTTQSTHDAGTTVELKNAAGETLLSTVSEKSFNNVVFSCDQIRVGETYTVVVGDETSQIEMTDTIYGQSGMGGFGGQGGFGGPRGMNGQDGAGMTEGQDGFGAPRENNGQGGFGGPRNNF